MKIEPLLLCAVTLAGCASSNASSSQGAHGPGGRHGKPVPGGPEALAAVDQNIQRLRALEVFEVGTLVVQKPKDEGCFVGEPCPGREDAWARARELAAVRLATFAKDAEAAAQAETGGDKGDADTRVDTNLAALAALNIVGVKAFVRATPANNPSCYGHPCEQDIAAAKAIDRKHAAKLEAIVRATMKK